jgi:hypothetical protein
MERKPLQSLPGKEYPQFMTDGKRLYKELKEKYPNQNDEDLDNILNALCAALVCLTVGNVEKDDRKMFLQIIYKILDQNT